MEHSLTFYCKDCCHLSKCIYFVRVRRDGVAVDRIIGFQELGGVDDFTTKALESRLLKAGIKRKKFFLVLSQLFYQICI